MRRDRACGHDGGSQRDQFDGGDPERRGQSERHSNVSVLPIRIDDELRQHDTGDQPGRWEQRSSDHGACIRSGVQHCLPFPFRCNEHGRNSQWIGRPIHDGGVPGEAAGCNHRNGEWHQRFGSDPERVNQSERLGDDRLLGRFVLLTDAISPVGGFESLQSAFLDELTARGLQRSTTEEFLR